MHAYKDELTVFGGEAGVTPGRWDAILADPEGNLWIRNPTQVRVRRPGSEKFVESLTTTVNSATASSVSLHLDPQGRLIVPTESGLLRGRGLGWERIGIPQGLPTNPTCCVLAVARAQYGGLGRSWPARWVVQRGELDRQRRPTRQQRAFGLHRDRSGSYG